MRKHDPNNCPELTAAEVRGLWVHYALWTYTKAGDVAAFIKWIEERTFKPLGPVDRATVSWAVDAFEDKLIDTYETEITTWGILEFMRRHGVKAIAIEEGELKKLGLAHKPKSKKEVH